MSTSNAIRSTSNPIRHAVRYALVAAAAASVIGTAPAVAQDSETAIAEVIVTGSRILRQDFESPSPIVTIAADNFLLSGEQQIETVLNSLPQLVPSITTTSNNPSNGGQAFADLRGLGAERTLVLMDGMRLPPSNNTGIVDLNTIPTGLIESIEILSGGASSTYGSDAVAGVVNFRMKRNFSGVEINVRRNSTFESDGERLMAEVLVGGNFADNRGNAVLAFSYDKRDEILAGARPFSVVSLGPTLTASGSGTVPEGRIDWGANAPAQTVLDSLFGNGLVTPSTPIGFNTDGTLFSFGLSANPDINVVNFKGDTSDPGYNPNAFSYNFAPVNYLQLPLERRQVAAFGRYDVVPDRVEMYGRLMYSTYNADQQLASSPITCASPTTPGCTIPVTNAAIPAELRTLLESRADPDAPLTFTKRLVEAGARIQENQWDVVQGLIGLRGDFDVAGESWGWDVFASWGRAQGTQLQSGNVSRSALQRAYDDPTVYASSGCALFNPFGVGNLTPECAAQVSIDTTNVIETEQINIVASLSGALFALPAGQARFAAGAEYRQNDASFRPDQFLASGDVVGFNAGQPVAGRITVMEPFLEVAVPIIADVPGARYVGLDLGYRHSDYNLAGSVDTYKVGLQWNPIDEVKFRGGVNRSIRAPNINELFLPRQENFPQYTDPCNASGSFRTGPNADQVRALCIAQGIPEAAVDSFSQVNPQARAFVGGNKELKPEKADGWGLGFTYQSSSASEWFSRFNVSLDYYSIEIEDVIDSLTTSSIVGRCFNQLDANPTFDPNNPYCQLFSRNPANFGVTDVVTTDLNLSAEKAEGIDMNLDWGLPLTAFGASDAAGDLNFRLLWTYILSREQQETVTDPFIPREGTISQTVGSAYPKHKVNLVTTYTVADVQLRYGLQFIDGMRVVNNDALLTPSTSARPTVPSYVYHDLSARWNMNSMLGITVGVNNIFDKDPPIYTTNSQAGIQSNTDPSTYDVLGRRYFVNFTASF